MPKLPVLRPRELIWALTKLVFFEERHSLSDPSTGKYSPRRIVEIRDFVRTLEVQISGQVV